MTVGWPSRPVTARDLTGSNRSRNVACAGTVLVEARHDAVVIQRFDDHQAMIDRLRHAHAGTPLCRTAV